MKRPSGDQSVADLFCAVSRSNSSFPAPLVGFRYKLFSSFRGEPKAIRLPSGDQTGLLSGASFEVKRLSTPRLTSSNQISVLPFASRRSAKWLPSGESEGSIGFSLSEAPTFPISLPDRSNHTN